MRLVLLMGFAYFELLPSFARLKYYGNQQVTFAEFILALAPNHELVKLFINSKSITVVFQY